MFISRIPGRRSANPAHDKREHNTWCLRFRHVGTRRVFLPRGKSIQAEMGSIYPGSELLTLDTYYLSYHTKVICLPFQDYWSSARTRHQESRLLAWHGMRWRKDDSVFTFSCKCNQRFQKSLSRTAEWSPPRHKDPYMSYSLLQVQASFYINTEEDQSRPKGNSVLPIQFFLEKDSRKKETNTTDVIHT